MNPRVTRLANKRVREAGGRYDRSLRVFILPAQAGVPEMRFGTLAEAYAAIGPRSEAIARATGIAKPVASSKW